MTYSPRMQVLLVEDEPEDLRQYERDFPAVFESRSIEVDVHACNDFKDAINRSSNPLYRFDLIISDTYRGKTVNGDAAVLEMVNSYRGQKFCPLVVYSSGIKPLALKEGPFLLWADKARSGDIERAINAILDTNIPQLARAMHYELERATSKYLWGFLEERWTELKSLGKLDSKLFERIVRRRASIQIGDIDPNSGQRILDRDAAEYYIYPSFPDSCYSLGDVLKSRSNETDLRVILTPHCHLFVQRGENKPRADHVLLAKVLAADVVLGEKLENAKALSGKIKDERLRKWGQSPANSERRPAGRHWFLPAFIDIPHSFCDFMQVESVTFDDLCSQFERIATLTPPYAEALQSCFANFYASVGIPNLRTESIESILR